MPSWADGNLQDGRARSAPDPAPRRAYHLGVRKFHSIVNRFGAGPSFGISVLRQDSAINNIAERLPDGELKIRSHGFGVGGVVGVMIEPTATTRFGVQYTTPMSFTYENIIDSVQGLGPGLRTLFIAVGGLLEIPAGSQVDLKLTMPQQVMASAYHQFNDRLALMGNFGWQNWNAFGQPSVIVHGNPNRRFTVDQGYEDTFHTAIGIHYRVAEKWLLMGGFAYDSSAVSDSRRTVGLPRRRAVSLRHRRSVGRDQRHHARRNVHAHRRWIRTYQSVAGPTDGHVGRGLFTEPAPRDWVQPRVALLVVTHGGRTARHVLSFILVLGLGGRNPYVAAVSVAHETYGVTTDLLSPSTQEADTQAEV